MRNPRFMLSAAFTASALLLAGCATAQRPGVSQQDHQAHHAGAAATNPGAPSPKSAQSMAQGGMGMGMMRGQEMTGHGSMDMCPMMSGGKSSDDHTAMMQQRLKKMSPDQVKQAMSMMDKHISMMQADMQMMRDHLGAQGK